MLTYAYDYNDSSSRSVKESVCPYHNSCHFYSMPNKTPHSEVLLEKFCHGRPDLCRIHNRKSMGHPVSITLWPDGGIHKLGNV